MGVMPLLLVCSVLVAGSFLLAFLWATRRGQYDDMATPPLRVLFDDRHGREYEVKKDTYNVPGEGKEL